MFGIIHADGATAIVESLTGYTVGAGAFRVVSSALPADAGGKFIYDAGSDTFIVVSQVVTLSAISTIATWQANLGYPAKRSGIFTLIGSGLIVGKPVAAWLAPGPYPGKGYASPDEVQFYEMQMSGIVTSPTAIKIWWNSRHCVGGNVKLNIQIGA